MPPECDRRERSRPSSVSVVIPAYNAAATVGEPLEALAAQQNQDGVTAAPSQR
jgi:GT2 family glycosyltransferase